MSLIFMLFYWVVFPFGIIIGAWWLFSNASTKITKTIVLVAGVFTFSGYIWLTVGERWVVDNRVKELCEKDGGVNVYESISLPPEKFNKWGSINFYVPTEGENALGDEYIFKRNRILLKEEEPSIIKVHTMIIRRKDMRLLGESTFYKRSGGGLPGPWFNSGYGCPILNKQTDILRQVFIVSKDVER